MRLKRPLIFTNKVSFREATGAQVNGYPNGLQRGFKTYNEARSAWLHARANNTVGPPQAPPASIPVASIPALEVVSSLTLPALPPPKLVGLKSPGKSVATPSPRTPQDISQPFPSVSTPPPRNDRLTQRRPAPHPMSISDEDAFWVVTRGEHPGVYHGRYKFLFALLSS